jgi:hypothetical protein
LEKGRSAGVTASKYRTDGSAAFRSDLARGEVAGLDKDELERCGLALHTQFPTRKYPIGAREP